MKGNGNKLLYALLSLIFAFGLWIYVVTVENPEYEETFENIPVKFANESALADRGLMMISSDVPTVTLRLSGNRSNINKLSSSNITLIADLSKVYDAGEQPLSYSIIYPGDIPNNSISLQHQVPVQITLNIVERKTKEVGVQVVYNGSVPGDYIADKDNLTLDYTKISVTGPASVINQIDHARIEVDLTNATETISQSYPYVLCNKDGDPVDTTWLTTDVSEVNLTLKILRVKEVELELEVTYGGGATPSSTTITLNPESIKVSGSNTDLEDLDSLIIGKVDLGTLVGDEELTFSISDSLPDGVTNLTGVDEVTVSIDMPDFVTKTLRLTEFVPVNLPSGMKVVYITKVMEVVVRGTSEEISAITEDDLTVRVDFSNAEVGDDQYKPQITVSSQFDSVSIVSADSIYATVTRGT